MVNNKTKKRIQEIKKDCFALKKKNDLTEFGEGQLSLIYGLEED